MALKRLMWRLYLPYLAVILLSLVVIALYSLNAMKNFHIQRIYFHLEARARLLEDQVSAKLVERDMAGLQSLIGGLASKTKMRITVVLPTGKVVADSDEDPAVMANHSDRPEIIEAMEGRTGSSIRYSYTLKERLMYLAAPIEKDGALLGILRVSLPVTFIDRALKGIYLRIAAAFAVVLLLMALVSLIISRRISRPLEEMRTVALMFSKGELEHRLPVEGPEEIVCLAEAMNEMAARLDDQINAVVQQKNELETVLAGMVEGVIAVDNDEKIISLNKAASDMLKIDPEDAIGRTIQEAVRNTDLQKFARKALSSAGTEHDELVMLDGAERYIAATGTRLRDSKGESVGALAVLNDLTEIRKLDIVRKDFVANVSHELRTPITSIKGFVETLLDGAMEKPEDMKRFLQIILKQANRLNSILGDLLTLSRIERHVQAAQMEFAPVDLKAVLESAVELCSISAREKRINVELDCPEGIEVSADSAYMEQAVVNLIDNAVKYSDPDTKIEIKASIEGNGAVITVRDHGVGIAPEHLSRIFERFYRVDKARSRDMGGTGLGLSIVKHVVMAHGGGVSVESEPGKGSLFTVRLPIA